MTEQELMLMEVHSCSRAELYLASKPMTEGQAERLCVFQQRRMKGEPLQYIFGKCEFMGISLHVDPRVFIPRPETELLVEHALTQTRLFSNPCPHILDIGTGSGNIAIALARQLKHCHITAIDISWSALDLAKHNATIHGAEGVIHFQQGNVFEGLSKSNPFDMIISNPPYVPTALLAQLPKDVFYEPSIALDGGVDGLDFYKKIITQSPAFFKKGGIVLLEIGETQAEAILEIFQQTHSFDTVEVYRDLCDRDRIILGRFKG